MVIIIMCFTNILAIFTSPSVALPAVAAESCPASIVTLVTLVTDGLPSVLFLCSTSSFGLFPSSSHAVDPSTSFLIALFESDKP